MSDIAPPGNPDSVLWKAIKAEMLNACAEEFPVSTTRVPDSKRCKLIPENVTLVVGYLSRTRRNYEPSVGSLIAMG